MKILTLFLLFIYIALCSGVHLLPNPGQLPQHPGTNNNAIPQIIGLNNIVGIIVKQLTTNILDGTDQMPDNVIMLRLGHFQGPIVVQYNYLGQAIRLFNDKLNWINGQINLHEEPPNLELAVNNLQQPIILDLPILQNLRDRNIYMQNVIISAMNFIKGVVNVRIYQNQLLQNLNIERNQILVNLNTIQVQGTHNLNEFQIQVHNHLNVLQTLGIQNLNQIQDQVYYFLNTIQVQGTQNLNAFRFQIINHLN